MDLNIVTEGLPEYWIAISVNGASNKEYYSMACDDREANIMKVSEKINLGGKSYEKY